MKVEEKQSESKILRVKEMVNADVPNIWNAFTNGISKACDKVCGKKGKRIYGDTWWWWCEEVNEAIRQKKLAYKMSVNRSKKTKVRLDIRIGKIEQKWLLIL